ncbi:MAG: thermonuclease family protein [Weeksellaceae bacterium]|nr:thermonuclease family protein [Weeksellaceae bacterium]
MQSSTVIVQGSDAKHTTAEVNDGSTNAASAKEVTADIESSDNMLFVEQEINVAPSAQDSISIPKSVAAEKAKVKIRAKVIGVRDGDTVDMLYHSFPIAVRLEHIDAPERRSGQPFNQNSKKALSDLVFGKETWLMSDGTYDRYGRIIGVLFTDQGLNVNKEMVKQGMAWHYKKYSTDMSYDQIEQEARNAKRGLWSDSAPIAPWNWSSRQRN